MAAVMAGRRRRTCQRPATASSRSLARCRALGPCPPRTGLPMPPPWPYLPCRRSGRLQARLPMPGHRQTCPSVTRLAPRWAPVASPRRAGLRCPSIRTAGISMACRPILRTPWVAGTASVRSGARQPVALAVSVAARAVPARRGHHGRCPRRRVRVGRVRGRLAAPCGRRGRVRRHFPAWPVRRLPRACCRARRRHCRCPCSQGVVRASSRCRLCRACRRRTRGGSVAVRRGGRRPARPPRRVREAAKVGALDGAPYGPGPCNTGAHGPPPRLGVRMAAAGDGGRSVRLRLRGCCWGEGWSRCAASHLRDRRASRVAPDVWVCLAPATVQISRELFLFVDPLFFFGAIDMRWK